MTYGKELGLKDQVIACAFEDSRGSLWLGSPTGGIARLSGGATTVFDEKNGLSRNVRGICESPDGTIWFAADDGLHTFRNGRVAKYSMGPGPDSTQLRAFLYRKSGGFVVADANAAYQLIDGRWKRLFTQSITSGIGAMAEDAAGDLWIGSYESGVYRLGIDSLVHISADRGFTGTRVYSLYVDREGNVWIGTADDGLFFYRNGKFTQFTPENGLFGYGVANIIEDDVGSMWFSGNQGVYRIRKQALEDFASGKSPAYSFDQYGTADGMKSRETNVIGQPSVWKMRDGRIVFTTVAGAAIVDPARLRLTPFRRTSSLKGFPRRTLRAISDRLSRFLREPAISNSSMSGSRSSVLTG